MCWFLNWEFCKILGMKELRGLIRLLRNLVNFLLNTGIISIVHVYTLVKT